MVGGRVPAVRSPRCASCPRAPWQGGDSRVPPPPNPLQTSQGVQVRRFKTLSELISLYLQPNQGLVCTLLFPVEREKEKEGAEDRDYSGRWLPASRRGGISVAP